MLALILAICGTSIFTWLYIRWWKVKTFWANRNVPHSPPHPIFGSLTFLQKENTAVWLRRLYNNFKTPYIGIWIFWRPGVIVNDPDLARRILVKDADNFRNRLVSSGKSDPIGALNIFTLNDPLWTDIRKRLSLMFTSARLRSLQTLTKQKVNDLIIRISEEMKDIKDDFDLRELLSDYTTDVIGEASFGLKSESTRTGDSAFRRVTRDFMHFSTFRGLSWSSIFFIPELVDIFRFSLFPKESMKFLKQIFRKVIEQRGGLDVEPKEQRDLLDALLKMRYDAKFENQEMSEDLLLAQATAFLQGGFDTSGTTLAWLIYELAHNSEVQETFHRELMDAKQQYGTDDFDSTHLSEMVYLNAIIKESLRKYPVMGWLDRVAAQDYKLDDKLTIAAGTVIYVNAYGMQMDPEYFPEPDVFDPERFMPENAKNIKPFSYIPFGEGPRICIGMRFGQQTMRFAIAAICMKYKLEPLPNTPKPNECKYETKGLFLLPDGRLPIKFVSRN